MDSTGQNPTPAVTVIGWLTAIGGGAYAVTGGWLVAAMIDPLGQGGAWGWLIRLVAGIVAVAGVGLLLFGVLGLIAGLGVIRRRLWGRVLGLLFAVLAALLGFLWVGGGRAADVGIGLAHFLYSIPAVIILARNFTGGQLHPLDR